MRWEITGTHGPQGLSITRVYEAPSEEAATSMARRDGITVGGIDLLIDMPGFASAPPAYVPPPPPPPPRPWRVEGAHRLSGDAAVRQYMAHSEEQAAELARNDGLLVLRITRGDGPAPPPLDPYQAQFAAVTAPPDPMSLEGDPRGYVPPAPAASPAGAGSDWTSHRPAAPSPPATSPAPSASHGSNSRPHSAAAVAAADEHFEPLDSATLAALATAPAVAEHEPPPQHVPLYSLGSRPPAAIPAAAPATSPAEHEHPRLAAAASATFAFACAAYAVGGLGLLTALVAGIAALAQQSVPSGATFRNVAILAAAIGAPAIFAAVASHAISGACLGLREIVLRRRRKRDY